MAATPERSRMPIDGQRMTAPISNRGEMRALSQVPATAEVVVIGAGIVGAATTFALARAGLAPVLIEAGSSVGTLTTGSSAHSVRAQFSELENVAMMLESIAMYANFGEALGLPDEQAGIDYTPQGYLFVSGDPNGPEMLRARVDHQRGIGLPDVEYLDGDEIRHRFPWIAAEATAATFRAADGWIDACRATELFALASGAPIVLNTEVRSLHRENDQVSAVETDHGTISTNMVVLAAGPFTQTLAGEPLPITLVRRHRLIVAPRPEIPANAPMTIDAESGAHWRPHAGGALLAWARQEPPGPPLSPVPTDPTFPDMVLRNEEGVGRLAPFWRELAPRLTPDDLDLVAGQYDNTPDHKPLIGPALQTSGLWLHVGYSGHGIMGSPSGALLLADMMTGKRSPTDQPFSPARFTDQPAAHGERLLL